MTGIKYYHVFFTRLAVDLGEMSRGHVSPKSKAHIVNIIKSWFGFGSKFLYAQTVQRDFEVRLIYSPRYKDAVFSYSYPDFVKLYLYHPNPRKQPWRDLTDVPRPCLIHRLDADDQYSRDFFTFVELRANTVYKPRHDALLHTSYVQFHMRSGRTGPNLAMACPHFITVRLLADQALPPGRDPLHCKQHNVTRQFKTVSSGKVVLAMEGLTGHNIVNRWFGHTRGKLRPRPRFTYFGGGATTIG